MSSLVILVLGSPNDADGRLYSIARHRCECAAVLARDNPSARLLLTGGFGDHFNTTAQTHATYLRRYLVELGVSSERFLSEAPSRNTIEDATLSRPIFVESGARFALVVTSDFHVPRARWLFEREYAGLGAELAFVATPTDEHQCELDLAALKAHEQRALRSLIENSRQ